MVKHVPHYLHCCRTRGPILLGNLIFFPSEQFQTILTSSLNIGFKDPKFEARDNKMQCDLNELVPKPRLDLV